MEIEATMKMGGSRKSKKGKNPKMQQKVKILIPWCFAPIREVFSVDNLQNLHVVYLSYS